MKNPVENGSPDAIPASHPELWSDLGRELYLRGLAALRNGQLDVAVGLLIAALRRQPLHPGMRRDLVLALIADGRFQQALVQVDACLAADPEQAELHFARGTVLHALGESAKAGAAFTRAAAVRRPDQPVESEVPS